MTTQEKWWSSTPASGQSSDAWNAPVPDEFGTTGTPAAKQGDGKQGKQGTPFMQRQFGVKQVATAVVAAGVLGGFIGSATGGGTSENQAPATASQAPQQGAPVSGNGPVDSWVADQAQGDQPQAPQSTEQAEPEQQAPAGQGDATVQLTAGEAATSRHDGRTWTEVQVTLTNTGSRKLDVSPVYFKLKDTSGGEWACEFGGGSLQQQNVDPGHSVSGTVGVPDDLNPAEVIFLGDLFGGGEPVAAKIG